MDAPTLVVLAAGMGSRYGGVKQIDRIGMGGETLLEFGAYDAAAAGFGRIVFVVRRSIAEDFKEVILSRLEGKIDCALVFQEQDTLIDGASLERARAAERVKPWGTAHAVLCARPQLRTAFAVVNADDFYGRTAFRRMAEFLSRTDAENEAAIAAYRLEHTLSPAGPVSRGICRVKDGYLTGVEEHPSIERKDGRIVSERRGLQETLPPGAPVSMNFWGFPLSALDGMERYFRNFLARAAGEPKSEAYLPEAVDFMLRSGELRVQVLAAGSHWFGMTYREDRESAARRISALVQAGEYPSPLWRDGAPRAAAGRQP